MKERLTVSLSPEAAAALRRLAAAHGGTVSSAAEYVIANRVATDEALARWDAAYGPPDPEALAWAKRVCGIPSAPEDPARAS